MELPYFIDINPISSDTDPHFADYRRNLRPLFLDPVDQKPLPRKRYYDIASYLATQATFSFVVAPFVILDFGNSVAVWSKVYFYAILTTFASLAFFASPGKQWLKAQNEKRSSDAGVDAIKSLSTEDLNSVVNQKEPILGLSQDPGRDANEMVGEIRAQVETARAELVRRRNQGQGLKDVVAEKTRLQGGAI